MPQKKFDTEKKVAKEDIDNIIESVRLTATSYGLQPFKIIHIENKEIRENLKPLAWGQTQITDASHLFVFANHLEVTNEDVETMMRMKGEINNIEYANLEGYTTFIQEKVSEKKERKCQIGQQNKPISAFLQLLSLVQN